MNSLSEARITLLEQVRTALSSTRLHPGDQRESPPIQARPKKEAETIGDGDVDHQLASAIHDSAALLNALKETMHRDAPADQGSGTGCFEPMLF